MFIDTYSFYCRESQFPGHTERRRIPFSQLSDLKLTIHLKVWIPTKPATTFHRTVSDETEHFRNVGLFCQPSAHPPARNPAYSRSLIKSLDSYHAPQL